MTSELDQTARADLLVRELVPTDVDVFRSLRLQALEESPDAYAETLEDARRRDWHARVNQLAPAEPKQRAAYLAFLGVRPVGMIVAGCDVSPEPPFLAAFWVHPAFRRRGVGRALVAAALAFLRTHGQDRVCLWVTESHREVFAFYEALGFELTGASAPLRPGSDVTILEMAIAL